MSGSFDPVRANLEWIARDYASILVTARAGELDLPTNGTRWTNRQLLFHMLLGQRITWMVIGVMGVFARLPPSASRAWASGMAATTPLYHRLNWLGGVLGGRLFTLPRMRRQMDALTARILDFYDQAAPADLARGMTIPPSWDPYFTDSMDRTGLLAWAPQHYQHHRRQLTLSTLPNTEPPHLFDV
ncbi:MAG: DinB family protein [Nigerium sp.]|nr:DinB family protein [Nigerium sp.]